MAISMHVRRPDNGRLLVYVSVAGAVVVDGVWLTELDSPLRAAPILLIPIALCAMPLLSRRHQGRQCMASALMITLWTLMFAYFGGAIHAPLACMLFVASFAAPNRWLATVALSAALTASFFFYSAPSVFSRTAASVLGVAVLYRLARHYFSARRRPVPAD